MNKLAIDVNRKGSVINRNIYGHFIEHLGNCVYEGIWVGENSVIPNVRGIRSDVVNALKKLGVPVLRWPGGCFAEEYHWKDGIGPREARPIMLNTHWGGVVESNHFGTHEFFDLCGQLECAPYVCGNLGSGTVLEMQQWVEYMTVEGGRSPMAEMRRRNGRSAPWRLPYFGIGNENWGCGGCMRPEYYADLYKQYQTFVRNLSGNPVFKIACGASETDYNWTQVVMREAGNFMHGLAPHRYCYRIKSATRFEEEDWFALLKMAVDTDGIVTRHCEAMDRYDPEKRVAMCVDEWGTWHEVEPGTNPGFLYQQNTVRDAVVAGVCLNIFNNHSDRVRMANIAQMVNVLQAMILTDEEKMILTPSYHVFEMFKVHQDATLLVSELQSESYRFGPDGIPSISASASQGDGGVVNISLCNLNPSGDADVACSIAGMKPGRVSGRVLTHSKMQAHNTFESAGEVKPADFTGVRAEGENLRVVLPAKSVVVLRLEP